MKNIRLSYLTVALLTTAASAAPPLITQQPQRRDVTAGMSAVFRVEATGSGTLTYQWRKGDSDLLNAVAPVLQIDDVQPADAGSYSVVVYNGPDSTASSSAILNVTSPLTNRALVLSGGGDFVEIASADRLQNPTSVTIEFWVYPLPSEVNQYGSFINKGDGIGATTARTYEFRWLPEGSMSVNLFLTHVNGQPDAAGFTLPAPERQWTHIAVTFDSAAGVVTGHVNEHPHFFTTTLNGTPIQGRTIRQTGLPLVFGVTPGFSDSQATGRIDELRIWDHARSGLEIAADYSCKLTGQEPGLTGYWPFDDGGVDDFTAYEQNGLLVGDAHTELISEGDLPVSGCEQPVFVSTTVDAGTFQTLVKGQLGRTVSVESTDDWETWAPAGSLPNSLGRQDIEETVQLGLKAFRAKAK